MTLTHKSISCQLICVRLHLHDNISTHLGEKKNSELKANQKNLTQVSVATVSKIIFKSMCLIFGQQRQYFVN